MDDGAHSMDQSPRDESPDLISLEELEPSPETSGILDLESGIYTPGTERSPGNKAHGAPRPSSLRLGLGERGWDYWLSTLQKYSTYPPSLFFVLHITNTSLIPLATRCLSSSEPYLLLTRPIYQSPPLEPVLLTIPVLTHVASGIALRALRQSRRARRSGAETREQRRAVTPWRRPSVQAQLGYMLIPLLGAHVLVNRITPLIVEGGSSSVGLGFVAHGIARKPWVMRTGYVVFVGIGVWHFVGGWAQWMGWKTADAPDLGSRRGSKAMYLGSEKGMKEMKAKRRRRWIVNGLAAAGTVLWLSGALGVLGRAGIGSGWEARNWDELYRQVPVLGRFL